MKHPFNKKRFWLVVGIVAILDVLILFLVFQWKYIFPSTEVSELYTKYANTEGVEASFVKDFRINDTVFVDVTMLEAVTDSGWDTLFSNLLSPKLSNEGLEELANLKWITRIAPKYGYSLQPESVLLNNDIVVADLQARKIAIFHPKQENQYDIILYHQYDKYLIKNKNEKVN